MIKSLLAFFKKSKKKLLARKSETCVEASSSSVDLRLFISWSSGVEWATMLVEFYMGKYIEVFFFTFSSQKPIGQRSCNMVKATSHSENSNLSKSWSSGVDKGPIGGSNVLITYLQKSLNVLQKKKPGEKFENLLIRDLFYYIVQIQCILYKTP